MSNNITINISSKIDLGLVPSPLIQLSNLNGFYIKVDSQNTEIPNFGGSKLRKIEYLLGSLKSDFHINEITSFGAFGSFHLKTMSYWCNHLGIKFHAKLWNQPWHFQEGRNFVSTKKYSTSIRWMPSILSLLYQGRVWKKSDTHAIVPVGGDKDSGAYAFYYGMLELNDQINLKNSIIFAPAGTCATVAGLFLGACKLNKNITVYASNIVSKYIPVKYRILKIAENANLIYDLDIDFTNGTLLSKFAGETYGLIDYGVIQSNFNHLSLKAKENGFRIDPTYTGKTFESALNYYKLNSKSLNGPIIFWNTRP